MPRTDRFGNEYIGPDVEFPNFFETSSATIQEFNYAGSIWKSLDARSIGTEIMGAELINRPLDEQHLFSKEFDWDKALEVIQKGDFTEEEKMELIRTNNDEDFYSALGKIHKTRENFEKIALGDGLGVTVAMTAAWAIDPQNLLGGSVLSKVAKLNKLSQMKKGIAIGTGIAVLEEGLIHNADPTASLGTSLISIGAVAAIGGSLGRLMDVNTARRLRFHEALASEIETDGAAAAKRWKGITGRVPKGLKRDMDAEIAPAFGFETFAAMTAPVVRLMAQPSKTIRNVAHRLMSSSFETTDNAKGIASPEALSHQLLNKGHEDHNSFIIGMERRWANYVTDGEIEDVGAIQQRWMSLQQRTGFKYKDKLNFKTFDEMVGKVQAGALLRSEVPDAVAEAADELNTIFKKWEPRAKRWWKPRGDDAGKNVPDSPDARYLTRRYNMSAIAKSPKAFLNFVVEQWVRKNPGHTVEELDAMTDIVGRRITKMLASPDERIHLEEIFDETTRGSMNDRYWDFIDDADLHKTDFVSHSALDIIANYSRGVINDTLFAEHFGTLSIKDIMDGIRKDTFAEFDLSKLGPKDIKFLEDDLELLENMIHRVRGTYMDPHSALPGSVASRAVSSLLKFNNLRLGGEFMLSSFPDIGRPVMHLGLMAAYGAPLKAFFLGNREIMEQMGKANKELRAWNIGNELHFNQRMNVMTDTSSAAINRTPLEEGLEGMNQNFFLLNGLTMWNQMLKRNTGMAVVDKIISSAEQLAKGKLPKKTIRRLAQMGLDADDLKVIQKQFEKHGTTVDRVRLNDFGNWDRSAHRVRDKMISAIQKEVDTIIVTPDVGDVPLLMSNDLVKLVAQYKTFALGSATRMTLRGLQDPDMNLSTGVLISILAGAAVQDYKEWKKDKDPNFHDTISSGIDRSGILTTIAMANDMLSQTPLGNFAITGAQGPQRWNPYLMGPTGAAINDALRATEDLGNFDSTQGGRAAMGRLLPFHNFLGLNDLMFKPFGPNEFTQEANDYYSRSQ